MSEQIHEFGCPKSEVWDGDGECRCEIASRPIPIKRNPHAVTYNPGDVLDADQAQRALEGK